MAKEIQPKKKIVVPPTNESEATTNLENGYIKAAAKTVEKAPEVAKEHRLTIDIPSELFDLMDEHRKDIGQSYKGLVISLLKKYFAEK